MRRAIIDSLMEARFPAAHLAFSGGDEADERAAEEMRVAAAAEQRRLEAMSDAKLEDEMEFAGPAALPSALAEKDLAPAHTTAKTGTKRAGGPKIEAAVEALRGHYGDTKPNGVSAKAMHSWLNSSLKIAGKDPVSFETLKRAKKALWPA